MEKQKQQIETYKSAYMSKNLEHVESTWNTQETKLGQSQKRKQWKS